MRRTRRRPRPMTPQRPEQMTVPPSTPLPARKRGGSLSALGRAMGYLRNHRWDAVGALVSLLCVSAATLATPQLVRVAVDRGITGHSERVVWLTVLGLIGVAAVRGVFSFVQGYLAERASQSVAYDMRNALFE